MEENTWEQITKDLPEETRKVLAWQAQNAPEIFAQAFPAAIKAEGEVSGG